MMLNTNLPSGGLQFRKLSDEKLDRIHAASLEILECTGLRLYEKESLALLKSRGVTVEDGNRVRISPKLVEWALSTAPKSTTLYDRHGKEAMKLEGQSMF